MKSQKIVKQYARLVKKLNRAPSWPELQEACDMSRSGIRNYFNSLEAIKADAKEEYSEKFKNFIDEDVFNAARFSQLKKTIKGYKRFLITAINNGDRVHYNSLKAVDSYAKLNDCLPVFMLINNDLSGIDSLLLNRPVVFDEIRLNKNLVLSTVKIKSTAADPISGFNRMGTRNCTHIFASPKQRMKCVATEEDGIPHVLMTTGAITEPDYIKNSYSQKKTDFLADHDHVMGAVIVEIENDDLFHYRQVQFDSNGSFIDLVTKYNPDGTTDSNRPGALIAGDWHLGHTDQKARSSFLQLASFLKPKRIGLHDFFNGTSVNHHERQNLLSRALSAEDGSLSLKGELIAGAQELNILSSYADELLVIRSNHDEFLIRYLQTGFFMQDAMNARLAIKLADAYLDGKEPLKHGYELYGLTATNIRWMARDESFKVGGVEIGAAHGDKGPNGSRGSAAGMELAYGNSVTGHVHTPEILRGAWSVGALEEYRPGYTTGPSSWLHSACIVHENGSRQMINFINGKWRK